MTLVPNETEQALNRQHDVYAAAREEYRKKIAEQAAEIERLRAALHDVLGWHDYSNDMHKPIEVRAAYMRARAALAKQSTTEEERA